jgi:hypothetical protein
MLPPIEKFECSPDLHDTNSFIAIGRVREQFDRFGVIALLGVFDNVK